MVTYQYNALGNLLSKQTGNIQSLYTYNDGQHLTGLENSNGDTVYSGHTYEYSLDGNRVAEVENTGMQKSYAYDGLGRLVYETITDADLSLNTSYTYDNRGNRLSKTSNGKVTSYSYDANNRLTEEISQENGSIAYYYDANGNTISTIKGIYTTEGTPSISMTSSPINLTTYTYDELNRLTSFTESGKNVSYTYGLDNLRKTKTVNNETTGFIWNGSNMVLLQC